MKVERDQANVNSKDATPIAETPIADVRWADSVRN